MTDTEIRLHQMIDERDGFISALQTTCKLLQKCLEEERLRNEELRREIKSLKISKN